MCKSLRVGVSFLIKLTELSFISHYMRQLYNKRTPAMALPCKFWKFFEISSRTPTGKYFCHFRPLWDFTTALKTVAVFLLLRCDGCPCAAKCFDNLKKLLCRTHAGNTLRWSLFNEIAEINPRSLVKKALHQGGLAVNILALSGLLQEGLTSAPLFWKNWELCTTGL